MKPPGNAASRKDFPYPGLVLSATARAFSAQDINPRSRTFGCCDRTFWNYKTLTDFPAATMQQLALAYAVLYSIPFPGNRYFQDQILLERARAAMLYWAKSLHKNGAADEWYKNEFSYCATAFTTFGISESFLMLREHLDPLDASLILVALQRSARWLKSRFNPFVMNQNLAACAALWNVHLCVGETWLRRSFQDKWAMTVKHQNEEGWFLEYGGADLGYSTLALDLLAALDRRQCPSDIMDAAAKLCDFLVSFACRNGDLAGGLGSRGTCHAFPFGGEWYSKTIPAAAVIAKHLRREFAEGSLVSPVSVDDRYLAYFYLPQFALACSAEIQLADPGEDSRHDRYWQSSGFVIWRRESADLVCSVARNGAFNLYVNDPGGHRNWGYWVETEDGKRWSSAGWIQPAVLKVNEAGTVVAEGPFVLVDDGLPLKRWAIAFHLFNRWILRFSTLAESFHRRLRNKRISSTRFVPLRIERAIAWQGDSLVVLDKIVRKAAGPAFTSLSPVADFAQHSPSARLYADASPQITMADETRAHAWAEKLSRDGQLILRTSYSWDSHGNLMFENISEQ